MANIPTCKGLFGAMEILGAVMGESSNGGANDVASTAKEVLVVLRHSPLRLLERVPYITASGRKVSTVVTTKGVFEKMGGELVLTGYIPQKGKSAEQIDEEIKSTIGWELKIAKDLRREEIPLEKLMMLRYFDPDRCFLN